MNDRSTCKRRRVLVTSVGLALLVAFPAAHGDSSIDDSWQQRTALLAFRNLPKRYTCEQLRVRVRDVLIRAGARSDVQVRPSRCERMLGAAARAPRVRVRFFVPASGAGARTRQVKIEPGAPESIDASDCALVRQMLKVLPGKVSSYRLACRAPTNAHPAFIVTVQALLPSQGAPLQAEAGGPRG